MKAVIKLEAVHKVYHTGAVDVHAVRGVSTEIQAGEFVAIMGASGSGKSTLMNLIGCLDRPTGGRYLLDGTDVSELDRDQLADIRNLKIGFIFQGFNLLSRTSALENVELPMLYLHRHLSGHEQHERARNALELVGLADRAHHHPNQLSGGQQQRVALGRCIVRNPKVFLFDEPLSNLDAKLRTQMRLEIKRLRSRVPTTSVFVTHDQVEAMTLGDRVVVMMDGRIQQAGTPLEVYGNPANKFVAGFIGAPSMNFLSVKISEEGSGLVAAAPPLRFALPPANHQTLAGWRDKTIIMGVRPEHLSLGNGISQCRFDAEVEVIEQLGSEIILETRIGDARITVARVDPQAHLAIGEKVPLSVPPDRLHFFDPITEAAIR